MAVEWSLLQPLWLLALPLVGLWLYLRRHVRHWPGFIQAMSLRYPPLAHLVDAASADAPDTRRGNRLVAAGLALAVVALAQPVQLTAPLQAETQSEPVDLVLVVGTAISMRLRDYLVDGQPVDRMSLARQFLDGLVSGYRGRRIGLVLLGNPPLLWLPLSGDKQVVRDAIARIRPVLAGRLSDSGATLALVGERFAGPGEKVVVMVSDGGLQLGAISPIEAAARLRAQGFSLYVIGLGASAGEAQSTEQGGLLFQAADLDMLEQVAEAGGGRLFHVQDAEAFGAALATIEARHRRPVAARPGQRLRTAWYPLPLGLGMLLLVLALVLPPSRKSGTS